MLAALVVLVEIALAMSESAVIRGNTREVAKLRATAWGSDEWVDVSRSGESDGRRSKDAGEHSWCCSQRMSVVFVLLVLLEW